MAAFFVLAALMLAGALAFVLPPLLRTRGAADPAQETRRKLRALEQARADGVLTDAEYSNKRQMLGEQLLLVVDTPAQRPRTFALALGVALALPALAIVLYRIVGTPAALDPGALAASGAPAGHEQNMDQAIAGLEQKLKQQPDDAEGWALLGRAYEAMQRFAEARDALKRAHDLSPDNPDVSVAYAEALALSGDSHRIEGDSRTLLETALKAAPDNQRGLWLLGISDYQAKKYDAAIASWQHLLKILPDGAPVARSIQHQIASAEAARDGKPPPPDEDAGAEAADTASAEPAAPASPHPGAPSNPVANDAGPHLTVKVTLDAKLKSKLAPDDVLFVYAKAAAGPPMPLAIQRLKASELPTTVVLTDGMGMMPSMKLSQFPQVIVGARVSKSGNAIAQSGDFQTVSPPVAVTTSTPIDLTIDHVVP